MKSVVFAPVLIHLHVQRNKCYYVKRNHKNVSLYFLVMSLTHLRVNPHSIVAGNSDLKKIF